MLLTTTLGAGAMAFAPDLWARMPASPAAQSYPVFGKIERLDPALDALIDADATVERIAEGFQWSEGPLWIGGRGGYLLISDPQANIIRRWSARDGLRDWLHPSGLDGPADPLLREPGTNGLAWGRRGLIVADSGNRCIGHIDLRTGRKRVIADRFDGKRFNSPNDLAVSPIDGVIYFTDPTWGLVAGADSPAREMDYTGVFRIGTDDRVELIGKYATPNGIALSADGRMLYHTDEGKGWIVHSLDAAGRSIGEQAFLSRAQVAGGLAADGMKVDRAGNLWFSSIDRLNIATSDGRLIGAIRGEDYISNCAFGADGHLYMSCHDKIARVRIKARGPKSST
ncbi:MAG: SMP-30/gluconolactonase/LRE family protein [Sphingobium sp.]